MNTMKKCIFFDTNTDKAHKFDPSDYSLIWLAGGRFVSVMMHRYVCVLNHT